MTTTQILEKITDEAIFSHYLSPHTNGKGLKQGENILSPLREEKNPSFGVYSSPKGWRFKDHGNGDQGDCFKLVMMLFNLTFKEALDKICRDFNLEVSEKQVTIKSDVELTHCKIIQGKTYKLNTRRFNEQEIIWWGKFGITPQILESFDVYAIEALDGFSKKKNKPYRTCSSPYKLMFGYQYGNTCIKIYQPLAKDKKHKFFYQDKREPEFVFGLKQLPEEGQIVIWTGGEKDVMSLAGIGLHAITGTSETGHISTEVFDDLKSRGCEVIIMFDNDKTGMEKSEQFSKKYGFRRVVLPEMPEGGKDISDYVKLKLPTNEILQLIENATVVMSDTITTKNEILDEPPIEELSKNEFAYDIWLYSYDITGEPFLKGLYRNGIILRLTKMGFYKRCRENNTYLFIRESENIIDEVEIYMMKDELLNYIKQQTAGIIIDNKRIPAAKLLETFLRQSHTIFNDNFLTQLSNHVKPILKDTKSKAYFFFRNLVVEITGDGGNTKRYNEIKGVCIWRKYIINRDFEFIKSIKNCHFAKFIKNVTNNQNDRGLALISAIGYLLHNHIEPDTGQAIILNDEEITDIKKPMGGTGKGLIANAIMQMRDVVKIDGKKFNKDDKFKFQNIKDSTQVVWLDDIKADFGLETFNSCLTDGWNIEKKFQDEFNIKPVNSPKMLICGNTVIKDGSGTTYKRRQFTIELSNYYSKQILSGIEKPIKTEHGCTFFDENDWDKTEWNKFYSYMLFCTCCYLKNGLQTYAHRNLDQNRLRQTTGEEFYEWVNHQNFSSNITYETKVLFFDFRNTYLGEQSEFRQITFTSWLKAFAESKNWKMQIKPSHKISMFVFTDGGKGEKGESVSLI